MVALRTSKFLKLLVLCSILPVSPGGRLAGGAGRLSRKILTSVFEMMPSGALSGGNLQGLLKLKLLTFYDDEYN